MGILLTEETMFGGMSAGLVMVIYIVLKILLKQNMAI